MRLFAALPIPDPAREEVAALLTRLRASDWPVRWVGDEGLHVTLKFYGEVAPERLEVIEESGKTVIRSCSCPLASLIAVHPELCGSFALLLSELLGGNVSESCQKGNSARCRFELTRS